MVSVVIPCYNEEAVLPALFERVTAACESWGREWEVICIDDGSRDATWKILQSFNARDPRWKALSFSRNFGHQTAVTAGMAHCAGAVIAVIDADLQDPPEELGRFIQKLEEGYDVVYGVRRQRKEGLLKRLAYWGFYRCMKQMVRFDIPLDTGDFGVVSRRMVDTLLRMPERNRFVRGLRAWAGYKQIGIPYERHGRAAGVPKYTLRKLFSLAFDGLLSFSGAPLRAAAHLGFWIAFLSFVGAVFSLLQRVFATWFSQFGLEPVPGFATIVISILFLGGVQLFFLGVLGEYLYRIFEEVKGRPLWIVAEAAGVEPKQPRRS